MGSAGTAGLLPDWVQPCPYPDLGDDGVLLVGKPDKKFTKQFVREGKRRLFLNDAQGSEVQDLEFLVDLGPYLEGLDVVGGSIDDSGTRFCPDLRTLGLNTGLQGVRDWGGLPRLRRLFAYGDRFGRAGFDALALDDLYVYGPKMQDLRPLAGQPLRQLQLAPARTLRSLAGLEGLSLTSLLLAHTRSDLDLAALASQRTLEHLNLDHVTVNSLEWVGELPNLKTLVLGDVGPLATLGPLQGHARLETLRIYGKNRPPAAEADLIAALPNLRTAVVVGMDLPARLT